MALELLDEMDRIFDIEPGEVLGDDHKGARAQFLAVYLASCLSPDNLPKPAEAA